eukprot:1082285-Pelagomonas_calceolata.AAC.2
MLAALDVVRQAGGLHPTGNLRPWFKRVVNCSCTQSVLGAIHQAYILHSSGKLWTWQLLDCSPSVEQNSHT